MSAIDKLFQPVTVGSKKAPNRLAASPMEMNIAGENGLPTDVNFDRYRALAEGKWGIVFVEHATASDNPAHRAWGPDGLLLNSNTVEEFITLVHEFKKINPDALFIQEIGTGNRGDGESYLKISTQEIEDSLNDLIAAGALAAKAGFDGIDFKLCHGSLGNSLTGPLNQRSDKYGGGTVENRFRFVVEGITAIKEKISQFRDEFIIGARISENDLYSLYQMMNLFEDDLKLDFINISAWPMEPAFDINYVFSLAQAIKLMKPSMPVICSSVTCSLEKDRPLDNLNRMASASIAPDVFGFGRQTIADPMMPAKLTSGVEKSIKWCAKCNGCLNKLLSQQVVECSTYS
jgi:2,4-dienoyl-CoA reductase-like NADH-dependent reductase (Old Yellow Enzyme family)